MRNSIEGRNSAIAARMNEDAFAVHPGQENNMGSSNREQGLSRTSITRYWVSVTVDPPVSNICG